MTQATSTELTETFGPYFGSELDWSSCEILAIAKIDRKLLGLDTALYEKKWFDYRNMHPTMATYLFAHHFNRAYGDFMGECFDHKKRFMAAFKGKDVMAAREVKSFWKLRQKVDDMGMRYDFFMREAMAWCAGRGWKQPPRPAHLATQDEVLLHVSNMWELEKRAKIQWAVSARFKVQNYVGAPDQLAYEQYLISAIASRAHPKFSLHAALHQYEALRIEAAISHFPEQAIREACEISL
ncbi:hypothetical protein [Duganella sp. FT27W]|uniref:hypothetical protein n=1 Tax=Duganella sp. FT27W TaxID=2654636 RepID=UPI00128E694E|nr:hypothetical protein [Duganella sp. FT27W]MPQ56324.1 hypothetical protein [Duganella sp. FT27W]